MEEEDGERKQGGRKKKGVIEERKEKGRQGTKVKLCRFICLCVCLFIYVTEEKNKREKWRGKKGVE